MNESKPYIPLEALKEYHDALLKGDTSDSTIYGIRREAIAVLFEYNDRATKNYVAKVLMEMYKKVKYF